MALKAFERVRRIARVLGPRLSDNQRSKIAKARIELETLISSFLDASKGIREGQSVDAS